MNNTGVDLEDIKNYNKLGVNTNRVDIGPGIFTGDEIIVDHYFELFIKNGFNVEVNYYEEN